MIFGVLNPEKIWHQQLGQLPTSPVYCSHCTLLGNPKSHFSTVLFIHTSQYLRYPEENTLLLPYPPHLKMLPHYLVKCTTFSSDWTQWRYLPFLQTLVTLKKASCGLALMSLKRLVVICGKWNVRQATLQQIFKVTIFCTDTCFQSFSSLINCIIYHALLKFSPCRKKTLPQLVRIADWYSMCVKKWKRRNSCAFYKVVQWHFSAVVGKGVTVCFLLR